jgi:two-component system sensor histidine kinase UhpB
LSLRLRLTWTITLALLATLAVGGLLIYRHALHKIETEMQAAIGVGARIAANELSGSDDVADPRRRIERFIADFNGDRHLRAILLAPAGFVELSSTLMPPEEPAPQWLYDHFSVVPKQVAVRLPAAFARQGSLMLETDSHNEIGEVWNDMKLYLLILFIFCALVLTVLYTALGRALRPLRELTRAFNLIGEGDYHARVAVGRTPEIAALEIGFNRMAQQLAEMRQRNFRLDEQLETIQEEERVELARNLHDEISPLLFLAEVDATSVRQLAEGIKASEIVERAQSIQRSVADIKMNVKGILGRLRPSGLAALNLKQSIETVVEFWKQRRPEVSFVLAAPDRSFGALLDGEVLSIVRESLNNAMKHARPETIGVHVEETQEELVLEICDDGSGLSNPVPKGSFGILGMKERAARAGGKLVVESREGLPGVRVKAEFPLPPGRFTVEETGSSIEAAVTS